MASEQSYSPMFVIILEGTALVVCRDFSCFIILGIANPAQGLYSPMAVPQCALRTTSAASGRILAPLQNAW